jgi:translation elongation factor P/translation initiation factor 5A
MSSKVSKKIQPVDIKIGECNNEAKDAEISDIPGRKWWIMDPRESERIKYYMMCPIEKARMRINTMKSGSEHRILKSINCFCGFW